ncbi:tetratricopeptide repeat protein [Methanobacterium spitsbergense]|uniref:Tetratricopeptide repeat protein n=1 Tax=Methanobacterium spitsbergense TaxID=2874285 RepID=A0A8T5ULI7_9EURY|nr:tetratricopeptide repeat protein [Methanobacterium spitsbergense]MBZ2164544.1 tetratricopeptide repeat protein [Methanobacterium spitsbergense]
MNKNFAIIMYFLVGFYLIVIPFWPVWEGLNPSNLSLLALGVFAIMGGVIVLYDKYTFSLKLYKLILALLSLIEGILIIDIFINSFTHNDFIIYIILMLTGLLTIIFIIAIIYFLVNKREISKIQRGFELIDQSKYQEACDYFDKYVKSDPENPLAWSGKAVALLKLNKYEEALECSNIALDIKLSLNKFLVKKTINVIQLSSKGLALAGLKRYDEALDYFDKVLKMNPKYLVALNARACVLAKLKNYDEALKIINKAQKLSPKNAYILDTKAYILSGLGKSDEALQYYQKAIDINPHNEEIHYNKGKTHKKLQQYNAALDCFDESLNINPNFEDAVKAKNVVMKLIEK